MKTLSCVILAFTSLSSGFVFDCEYYESVWEDFGNPYSCLATPISTEDDSSLIQVTGAHLGENNNTDVEVLGVVDIDILRRIPRNIEMFFDNLIIMHWETKALEFINADDLKPFPNLKVFAIFDSMILSLDGDLFKHTPKLQIIFFTFNRIQHVGHDLLTDLNDLTEAYFESNPCISESAQTLEAVQQLNIQLPISCPQIPEPRVCAAGCLELIESLQRTVAEQSERLANLELILGVINV